MPGELLDEWFIDVGRVLARRGNWALQRDGARRSILRRPETTRRYEFGFGNDGTVRSRLYFGADVSATEAAEIATSTWATTIPGLTVG